MGGGGGGCGVISGGLRYNIAANNCRLFRSQLDSDDNDDDTNKSIINLYGKDTIRSTEVAVIVLKCYYDHY